MDSMTGMRASSQMEILSVSESVLEAFKKMTCPVVSVKGDDSGSMMMKVDNTVITIIQIAMVEMV